MEIFKRIFTGFLVATIALFAAQCASTQQSGSTNTTATATSDNGTAKGRNFAMDQANQALGDITYSPYGKGWAYKTTGVPAGDFKTWAGKFKPQIEKAIEAVGEGFALQVTGHTCSIGPREATDGKKGNIYYSTERAKAVFDSLSKVGIPTSRMTFVGVADDEPLSGLDTRDQRNRRVTFKIVQQN